ncbi:MAG: hypothetical protein K2K21_14520 [Lachnospiraceae bacterium]|nr:hypothetical protein [Lachnospiraceae bacterium]
MGKLREMIRGVDQSNETEKEIGEQLKILTSLGESKVTIFRGEIEASLKDGKTTDDLKVPITKVLGSYEEYRAYTKRSQEDLARDVISSFKTMFNGGSQIADGIGSLVSKSLSVLLGAGSGEEMMKKEYFILVEYPAIIRYDVALWTRNITVKSLQERAENVIACVAYKSAVDVTKLDFNTFLGCYANVLQESFGTDRDNIQKMIRESAEVYGMFQKSGNRALSQREQEELEVYTQKVMDAKVKK